MRKFLILGALVAGLAVFAGTESADASHCRYSSGYGSRGYSSYYSPSARHYNSSPRYYYGSSPRYYRGYSSYGHRSHRRGYHGGGLYIRGRNFSIGIR